MSIIERILSLFQGFNWLIIPAALLAIIFHEISHGYAAYLLGDNTARYNGRLSLNPLKHIDILGLLCMVFFGFGWAKPVPVNLYHIKNKRLGMFLVALAGPISNIILAFLAIFTGRLFLHLVSPESSVLILISLCFVEFMFIFAVLNIGLAVFNLIPVPPLDGSKILFSFLPGQAVTFFAKYERYGMLLLIILINIPFFDNALSGVREWLYVSINDLINLIFT